MSKRLFVLLSVLVAASMMLAACGGTPAPVETSAPASSASSSAPAAFQCTDKIGCVDIAPGDPIHIAFWGVLSGADAALGDDSKRGVELAIDAQGKLLDHDIQLTSEDALCTPEGGATAATKLAADTSIVALVGSSCSDETVGGIATLTKAGLTTISMSNTRPALTDPNRSPDYAGYLRTAYSDAFQGSAVADFAYNTLKVTKVATIHDGSAYAQALVGVFVDSFQKLGGTITDQEAVAKTDTDMRPVLTKIAATGPEAIYFPTFVAAGGYICAQMHSVPGLEKAAMLSSDGVASTDFLKACGPQVVGLYDSGPDFTQFPSTYKDLVAKYQAKYGQSPTSIYHGQAYDAAGIIFAAIQKVAVVDADGTVHIGRQALRDAIYATTDYQGVTGTLSCNASGDCGSHAIAVYQVANADLWDLTNATNPNPKKVWPTTP